MKNKQLQNKPWIFFDLDDTLIPSSFLYENVYQKLGLHRDQTFKKAKESVKNQLPKGHTSGHNRLIYFKKYLELKHKFSTERLLDLHTAYEDFFHKALSLFIKNQGLKSQLKKLKKNFNLALITNENCRTQMLKINCIDPKGILFNKVITSEEVGVEKPHNKIFEVLFTSIDLKSSKLSLNSHYLIGDSYENDYLPGLKFGLTPILTTQFKNDLLQRKVKASEINIISSLADFSNNF